MLIANTLLHLSSFCFYLWLAFLTLNIFHFWIGPSVGHALCCHVWKSLLCPKAGTVCVRLTGTSRSCLLFLGDALHRIHFNTFWCVASTTGFRRMARLGSPGSPPLASTIDSIHLPFPTCVKCHPDDKVSCVLKTASPLDTLLCCDHIYSSRSWVECPILEDI